MRFGRTRSTIDYGAEESEEGVTLPLAPGGNRISDKLVTAGTNTGVILMIVTLYVLYFAIGLVVLLITASALYAVSIFGDPNRDLLHRYIGWWGLHGSLLSTFWQVKVAGAENLDRTGACVYVANHQSFADISVVYALKKSFKWVAKDYLFKVPCLGPVMHMAGYVCMNSKSVSGIKRAMKRSKELLRSGQSLFIFPEGTRSDDGMVQSFYDGAFKLACEAGVPVVPVVIDGTFEGLPKNARGLRGNIDVVLRVLAPVHPQQFNYDSSALRNYVHDLISGELRQMRGRGEMVAFPVRQTRETKARKAS